MATLTHCPNKIYSVSIINLFLSSRFSRQEILTVDGDSDGLGEWRPHAVLCGADVLSPALTLHPSQVQLLAHQLLHLL